MTSTKFESKPLFTRQQLTALLLPLIAEQALSVTIGLADTLMVSSVGEAAVSGVSLVDTFNTVIIDDIVLGRSADRTADPVAIGFQVVKRRIYSFLAFGIAAQSGTLNLAIARQHLAFQPEYTKHTTFPSGYGINLSRIAHSIRYQLAAALFRHRNIML